METTLSLIAKYLDAGVVNGPDRRIDILLTDSRSLSDASHTLFFALRSPQNDGHRYIRQLYDAGVRAFVVDSMPVDVADMSDADFIVVGNTMEALQGVAQCHRERFAGVEVVGVTGSRGKTIVKEWLYQALADNRRITRSPRSYNSQIGVPLSVWQMNEDTQLGVFEVGVSQRGEMAMLEPIVRPTVGVMTSLGHDHDDGFDSLEEKCREKALLFARASAVVYSTDDDIVTGVMRQQLPDARHVTWSRSGRSAVVQVVTAEANGNGMSLVIDIDGMRHSVTVPFAATHLVDDALTVLAAQLSLGVPATDAVASLARLTCVGTRLSVVEAVNHCLLVVDQNRSADYHTLSTALDFVLPRLTPDLTLTVILGDMAHETMTADQLYTAVGRMLRTRGVGRVIGAGRELVRYRHVFDGMDVTLYDSATEMIESLSPSDFNAQLILAGGSEHDHMERLLTMLEARSHETVLEVNLDAMVHNFNYFRSRLRPSTGIVCMVKASGYGAGSYELAKTLQAQGASYLAVAVVDEGVELRQRGITMPVMVMNPKVTNYPVLFANRLEPEIYSLDILREIIAEGERCGVTGYPVHIKIDSGMCRLGFTFEDLPAVVEMLRGQNVVTPASVFSHLAAADMPEEDEYTLGQIDYFVRCADVLISAFPDVHIMRHILNSTGILRFPQYQFDLVRLGIGLYGVPTIPDDPDQATLQPVSTLRTVVISIKDWPAGTTVGYSRRGVLSRRSRVATLPVGYADGINRRMGYGNVEFLVNGHRCPTIGSICMDLCMVDVTDCPDVKVGDAVEIFGNGITAVELGDRLGTIPYEILTSVSQRVKRVYYRE